MSGSSRPIALRFHGSLEGWLHFGHPTGATPLHHHPQLEINFVTEGRATYLVGGRRYELTPGTLLWLLPETDHVIVDRSPDLGMWLIVFREGFVSRLCVDAPARGLAEGAPNHPVCKSLSAASAERLRALLRETAAIDREQEPTGFNLALGHLCLTAWRFHREAQEIPPASALHPAVVAVARRIRDGAFSAPLEELSRDAGLSASRLTRLFKAQTGLSITAYRQRQKLERALTLRRHQPQANLTDLALEAGFGSYAQFYRVYRREFGAGPRAQGQAGDEGEPAGPEKAPVQAGDA